MNDKELREIRRRFRPEKNNIMGVRGCFLNDKNEIVSEFYQPMLQCSQEECDYETLRSVHTQISEMMQTHKEMKKEEPLTLSKREVKEVLEGCGVSEVKVERFAEKYGEQFGKDAEVPPTNLVDVRRFEVTLPDVTIKVNPECNHLVSTQVINGIKYIMIQATEGVEVNGVSVNIK